MSRDLKRNWTGISLIMLALGFFLLGVLSFVSRLQGELAMASGAEQSFGVAGSAAGVLTGAIFLVAARIYWRR